MRFTLAAQGIRNLDETIVEGAGTCEMVSHQSAEAKEFRHNGAHLLVRKGPQDRPSPHMILRPARTAGPQANLLRTVIIIELAHCVPSVPRISIGRYLPVYLRSIPAETDTAHDLRLVKVARLAYAGQLRYRLASARVRQRILVER